MAYHPPQTGLPHEPGTEPRTVAARVRAVTRVGLTRAGVTGLALTVAGLAALTGCGAAASGPDSGAGTTSSDSTSTPASATSVPTPVATTPASTPSSAPSSPVSPPAPAAAPGCIPAQMVASLTTSRAASGHELLVIALRNNGSAACRIEGYPGLALTSAEGVAARTSVTHVEDQTFPAVAPAPVTVPVGASVSFDLGATDVPSGTNTSCVSEPKLSITLPDASGAVLLAARVTTCDGRLNVSPFVAGTVGVRR